MRKIENIVLHGSASKWGNRDFIRRIHVEERGWQDIGYNFIILNEYPTFLSYAEKTPEYEQIGRIVGGRDLDGDMNFIEEIGAHARGWNKHSVGICLISDPGTTDVLQYKSALCLCGYLVNLLQLRITDVVGHYELTDNKIDPYFDMRLFRNDLRTLIETNLNVEFNKAYNQWKERYMGE